jgi:hypothetical protein
MKNGMAKDFSWNASAKEYVKVYERVRKLRAAGSTPVSAPVPVLSKNTG